VPKKKQGKPFTITVTKNDKVVFSASYDKLKMSDRRSVTALYRNFGSKPFMLAPSAKTFFRIEAMSIDPLRGLHTMQDPNIDTMPVEDMQGLWKDSPSQFPQPRPKKGEWRKFRTKAAPK